MAVTEASMSFAINSDDGDMVCFSVTILEDLRVELDEQFSISLSLVTTGSSLQTGSTMTTITILDDDSEIQSTYVGDCANQVASTVASVSVPETDTVAESTSSIRICATLSAPGPLERSIELTLRTQDSSGIEFIMFLVPLCRF